MKALVVGSIFVCDEAQMELIKLSYKAFRVLNPDMPFVILDSASPFHPKDYLPSDVEIIRFPTNVGHLSHGGRDGAGRSFCESMQIAIDRGYDYVVCYEPDVLFAKPMMTVINAMEKAGVKAAALYQQQYQFPELGVSFFNVKFLKDNDIIKRYDWEGSPPWPIPEIRISNILGNDLWLLPYSGVRNDHGSVTAQNFAQCFPYFPPVWLTHCYQDFNLYQMFLNANDIRIVS